MSVAALIAWLVTAAGGFYLLGTWLQKGGMRNSKFPKGVVFGHFALAAVGLIIWIIFLVAGSQALAWVAFVLLVPIAALGFTMLARWVPTYRARTTVGGAARAAVGEAPAERHLPVAAVGAHGLIAVATVVIVLLAALGVGTH